MAVFGLPGQHVSVETFGGLTDVRPSQDDNIRLAPNTRYLPVESGLSFRTSNPSQRATQPCLAMILRSRAQ